MVLGIAVGIIAIIGTIYLYRRSAALGRPAFDAALASDFSATDSRWFHSTGLALDRQRRLLLIGTETGPSRVPLSEISSMDYQQTRTGPAFSGNSILTLILLPMAIGAMVHNASNAGLRIVAGGRSYRIVGIQPKDADRWLTQIEAARAG